MISTVQILPPEKFVSAAERLHSHLVTRHWRRDGLVGPDPGIRWNYRVGRFAKSALRALPWRDNICYQQSQGYWVLANWRLWDMKQAVTYRRIALKSTLAILNQQQADGAWEYPNREWKGRIATVEGIWACLALMESYRRTKKKALLDGVLRWNQFFEDKIGFQEHDGELAVNYFAGPPGRRVPNNSADALRYLASLYEVTGNPKCKSKFDGVLKFLANAQLDSGEFPYTLPGARTDKCRTHFQCYQYNAFQCLGLMQYVESTNDPSPLPIIRRVLEFLKTGIGVDGHAFYECGNRYRRVTYHSCVVGAAFAQAGHMGFEGFDDCANRAFGYVLRMQRKSGVFPYSFGDYRILNDKRSYPRYLAMMLFHLLRPVHDLRPSDEQNRIQSLPAQRRTT